MPALASNWLKHFRRDFFAAFEHNSTKLIRKEDLNVLYQVCVIWVLSGFSYNRSAMVSDIGQYWASYYSLCSNCLTIEETFILFCIKYTSCRRLCTITVQADITFSSSQVSFLQIRIVTVKFSIYAIGIYIMTVFKQIEVCNLAHRIDRSMWHFLYEWRRLLCLYNHWLLKLFAYTFIIWNNLVNLTCTHTNSLGIANRGTFK